MNHFLVPATADVELQDMLEQEAEAFLLDAIDAYCAEALAAGRWSADYLALRKRSMSRRSAGKRMAAGERFCALIGGGKEIGRVWLSYVYDEVYVVYLSISAEYRAQGFGRAAVRAIEQDAARGDATMLAININLNNQAALKLAAAQGFVTLMQVMLKPLQLVAPTLSRPGMSLVPMVEEQIDEFLSVSINHLALGMVEVGRWSAASKAERTKMVITKQHAASADVARHFCRIEADGQLIGRIWFNIEADEAYVMELIIEESLRNQGWGHATMRLIEAESIRLGARYLALNVFSNNAPAIAVYSAAGMHTVSHQMVKSLRVAVD